MNSNLEYKCEFYLALEYIISNLKRTDDLKELLSKLLPIIHQSQISLHDLLELLLVYIPETFPVDKTFKTVDDFFEESENFIVSSSAESESEKVINVSTLFKHNLLPIILQQLFSLPISQKTLAYQDSLKYVRSISHSYNWFQDENSKSLGSLFTNFSKARIFKLNDMTSSFIITDEAIKVIKQSSYTNLELNDWIKGFYTPLSIFSSYSNSTYLLVDYKNYLSVEEQIDCFINLIIERSLYSTIIDKTLVPYMNYCGDASWKYFNQWLISFGNSTVNQSSKDKIVKNYQILLDFIRQDSLLIALKNCNNSISNEFVSVCLSIIYLCPKAILEVFVDSKEILRSLKTLNLENGNPFNISQFNKPSTDIREFSKLVEPTNATINNLLKIIESGERLYANELSFYNIINLELSSHDVQLAEFSKFIDNESKFGDSIKQWTSLLSSTYWISKNTKIFDKINPGELSNHILIKLLDLKQFNVISNVFLEKYCTLTDDELTQILLKYSWSFYKQAANVDKSIGSLKNCLECLNLIKNSSSEADQLKFLVDANNDLLNWKFYFKVGVPVTPKRILEIHDPFKIIRRILEINDDAYKHINKLYDLLKKLIIGFNCSKNDEFFRYAFINYDDSQNLLLIKLKVISLEFSSALDYKFSFNLAIEIINNALDNKEKLFELFFFVGQNWFLFFQIAKNEYDNIDDQTLLKGKLQLLGKLLLVAPTEFNTSILEQWQMLNSQREHYLQQKEFHENEGHGPNSSKNVSLGDFQTRLQNSLQSSANDLIHGTDGTDLGKNIIGWIVGAR